MILWVSFLDKSPAQSQERNVLNQKLVIFAQNGNTARQVNALGEENIDCSFGQSTSHKRQTKADT